MNNTTNSANNNSTTTTKERTTKQRFDRFKDKGLSFFQDGLSIYEMKMSALIIVFVIGAGFSFHQVETAKDIPKGLLTLMMYLIMAISGINISESVMRGISNSRKNNNDSCNDNQDYQDSTDYEDDRDYYNRRDCNYLESSSNTEESVDNTEGTASAIDNTINNTSAEG